MSDQERKLLDIFFPNLARRESEIISTKRRFVHYTNAEAAAGILRTRRFWLRDTSCMNDISEIHHGLQCVQTAYSTKVNDISFRDFIEREFPGITEDVEKNLIRSKIYFGTTPLSGVFPNIGTMKTNTGVYPCGAPTQKTQALRLCSIARIFFSESDALNSYFLPVEYRQEDHFLNHLAEITELMRSSAKFLLELPTATLTALIVNLFRFSAISTKHVGFQEELEWRIVHSPSLGVSEILEKEIETISGTPQTIYKIPLTDVPSKNLTGIELPEIVERIIIGPTQYPAAIRKAFIGLLTQAGDANAEKKVIVSGLPLRT